MHGTALPLASARFIRHTGRAAPEIAIEKARWLLGWDRSPRSKRGRARRKSGAGSPRLLRVKEKGHFALRPARSLSPRRCLELAAIPGGLAHTLSFSESRLRRALLGSSRLGGVWSGAS